MPLENTLDPKLSSFISRADGERYVVFTCAEISPEYRQLDYYSTVILRAFDTKSGFLTRSILVDDREGKIWSLFRGSIQAAREVHNRVINALFKYPKAEWMKHIPHHLPDELTPDMKRLLGRENPRNNAVPVLGDTKTPESEPAPGSAKLTDAELAHLAKIDYKARNP